VEAEPRLDGSRPSGLRFAGFLLAVAGAMLLGVGSIQTWVTVGVRGATTTDTSIPGTDMADGKITLACAIVVLLAVVAGRLVHDRRARMALASVVIAAGFVGALVAAAFLQNGIDRQVVLDALGIPSAQWEQLGAFREYGLGPWLALSGGVLGFVAGILTLAWAQRLGRDAVAAQG